MVMLRKNLTKKFKNILENPVTIISTPDGYGKTSYIKQFVKKEKIQTLWIEGTKKEEMSVFWNTIKREAMAKKVAMESLFDDTSAFSKAGVLSVLQNWDAFLQEEIIIVIDDFHKLETSQITSFLLHVNQLELKNIHFLILTQYISNTLLLKLYEEEECYTISVQDFKIELFELLKIVRSKNIDVTKEQLVKLLEYTSGWAPAIELALQAYDEGGSLFDTSQLQELLRKGKFEDIQEEDILSLLKLALLPTFSTEQANYICDDTHIEKVINGLAHNHLFVNKIDLSLYTFSPIFRSYLKEAMCRYDIDKKEIYQRIANWYIIKNDYIHAIKTLLEGGCFESIIRILTKRTISFAYIAPKLMQEVFRQMPVEYKYQNPLIYLSFICDSITNLNSYNGLELLEEFKEDVQNNRYLGDTDRLMGEYYYIHAFSRFNDVEKMMEDFHQAYDLFQGKPSKIAYPGMIASFGSYQILYLYYCKEGKLQELTETIIKESTYFVQISHGCSAGNELQVQAEYNYLTGNYKKVENYAMAAYKVACSNNQTSICIAALFQLGRLAILQNKEKPYLAIVAQLQEIYEQNEMAIIKKEVDLALGHLYILNDEEDEVASWIIEESIHSSGVMHAASQLPDIVNMLYLLKKERYVEAESCSKMLVYENSQTIHRIALLYAKMAEAIICFNSGQKQDAYTALRELLKMARKDKIVSIFIEFNKQLYPMIVKYRVENEFEKEVCKKVKERNRHNNPNEINKIDLLSKREKEISRLYVDSLTARDIANKMSISHNTVLFHLKTIYTKLGINKKSQLVELLERRKRKN